ncbi:hypothetical protein EYC87_01610 [Halieaceae bacterium IMCC8485]|uniref:Uncharacterized protein n=1 Tax=Candidatus Seongchinamella marina TaxID=2518990 RepID=A0ABT3SQN2_9GAMM|nr:hypothetical protein [Candidatus Seongchinamella marina]
MDFLDRRLRINSAIFNMDYTNRQLQNRPVVGR